MALSKKIVISKRKSNGGKGLFATNPIFKNEILITFPTKKRFKVPDRNSFQITRDKHIEGTADDIAYLNHSCSPISYFDVNDLCVKALRDILEGEEITCNYLATEYNMSDKFICNCGSPVCFGEIKGYKYLNEKELENVLGSSKVKSNV